MNRIIRLAFFALLLSGITAQAQTSKKPVKKAPTKQTQQKKAAERAAAIAKAKEDSVAAVQALAFQMAREMFVADSIRRVREEEEALVLKKEQEEQARLASEKSRKPGKKEKETAAAAGQDKKVQKEQERLAKEQKKKELNERKRNQAELDKKQRERKRNEPKEAISVNQETASAGGRGVGIGLKGFAGSTFLLGENAKGFFKPWIGYGGGLVVNLNLGKHISVGPEFLFNRLQEKYDEGLGGVKRVTYVDGIQASLPVRYTTGTYGKGFFVNVGPFGEYHFAAGTDVASVDIDKYFSYGAALGIGAALPVAKGRITIELRGNYYLGNSETGLNDSGVHRISPVLAVGYTFYFK